MLTPSERPKGGTLAHSSPLLSPTPTIQQSTPSAVRVPFSLTRVVVAMSSFRLTRTLQTRTIVSLRRNAIGVSPASASCVSSSAHKKATLDRRLKMRRRTHLCSCEYWRIRLECCGTTSSSPSPFSLFCQCGIYLTSNYNAAMIRRKRRVSLV